jgi:hypothetical protein
MNGKSSGLLLGTSCFHIYYISDHPKLTVRPSGSNPVRGVGADTSTTV